MQYEPPPKNKKISLTLNNAEKCDVLDDMLRFNDIGYLLLNYQLLLIIRYLS